MANAELQTHALVMLDGKEMTATLASPCLDVSMENVLMLHWAALATIQQNGLEDFVIFPCVLLAVQMDIALLLVYANVTQDGLVIIALIVCHSRDAAQLEAFAMTQLFQVTNQNHILANAVQIILGHCVINQSANQAALLDMENVSLHRLMTLNHYASATLDGKVLNVRTASNILAVQLMPHA